MEENGKRVNPNRGMWAGYLSCVIVPAIFITLIFVVVNRFFDHPFEITLDIALGLGGICGACYIGICCLVGVTDGLVAALFERIRETREMYDSPFEKEAIKWYWTKFYEDGGIILWAMVFFFLLYAAIATYGIVNFVNWYNG